MFTKRVKFILVIVIQLIIIFSIVAFKVSILKGGTEVILRIRPVDPRDPLRGDYVTFQYDISSPAVYTYTAVGQEFKNGDTVYVELKKAGAYWVSRGVLKDKPTRDDMVFIKGKVASGGLAGEMDTGLGQVSGVRIVYGIEEYFIPEGTGRVVNFWSKEVVGKVMIDKDGNSVLKQIYVEGEPWP